MPLKRVKFETFALVKSKEISKILSFLKVFDVFSINDFARVIGPLFGSTGAHTNPKSGQVASSLQAAQNCLRRCWNMGSSTQKPIECTLGNNQPQICLKFPPHGEISTKIYPSLALSRYDRSMPRFHFLLSLVPGSGGHYFVHTDNQLSL